MEQIITLANSMGLDAGVIVGISFLTLLITKVFDPDKKFSRWYPLIPVVLGLIAAVSFSVVAGSFELSVYIKTSISYAGISAIGYKLIKSTVLNK